jgi:hypothetical protein
MPKRRNRDVVKHLVLEIRQTGRFRRVRLTPDTTLPPDESFAPLFRVLDGAWASVTDGWTIREKSDFAACVVDSLRSEAPRFWRNVMRAHKCLGLASPKKSR